MASVKLLLKESIKNVGRVGDVVEVSPGYARNYLLPQDLPFVFEKFYRAEANNKMAAGTGLGLSLVKHVIEVVHHGRMFVESQVGKGSTFGFELDLCE